MEEVSDRRFLVSMHAELRLHIHTLQQVLIKKDLASEEDLVDVMNLEMQEKMKILLVEEFAEKLRKVARSRPPPRTEPAQSVSQPGLLGVATMCRVLEVSDRATTRSVGVRSALGCDSYRGARVAQL